jgi:hypothetical protein
MLDVVLKRFGTPDETRTFDKGRFDIFYIGPGHDSWVVGDEPCVSLHFLGAETYARAKG